MMLYFSCADNSVASYFNFIWIPEKVICYTFEVHNQIGQNPFLKHHSNSLDILCSSVER